jgi:hypothetical protein
VLDERVVHAGPGLRSDTDLAAAMHAAGDGAERCAVAERYLSRFA